ncbi:hypothetical protein BaRGS_00012722 [Batillaria attramentaria]|uniref:G-protein coupled receptors family 2 profile 2 domain-containing protein n=1 Tax=Batillaria attramentaria TaxID=370345 RepID=A0ABD0L9R4_9CAEN
MSSMDIAFVTVTATTSILSVLGCVVIIGVHIAYKSLRTTGRSMLVQLSIADLQLALGNLMGVFWYLFSVRSMAYCYIQSAWTIFSSIASFLWVVAIAVVTVTALACQVLGYDPDLHQASWCWIDPDTKHMLFWTFWTGKAWELSAYCLTVVLYSAVKIALIRHEVTPVHNNVATSRRQSRRDVIQEANVKLTFVPLVFIVMRVWGTIRFLLGVFDHEYASSPEASWIVPLQGMGDSCQGFANFIVYCFFTSSVRRRLLRGCRGQGDVTSGAGTMTERSSRPGGMSTTKVDPTGDETEAD